MQQNDPMGMEEYLKMLNLGQDNQKIDDAIRMQMAQAEYMRQGSAPQMREAGRVVKAPGILEVLGGLAKQKVAANLNNGVMDMQNQRRTNTAAQNEALIRAMLRQPTAPVPNAAPGMIDPTASTPANGLTPKTNPFGLGGGGGY